MKNIGIVISVMCLLAGEASASPLVYTPVNPNFGGNPNNASLLLGEAADNNHFQAKAAPGISPSQAIANDITEGILTKTEADVITQINAASPSSGGSVPIPNGQIAYFKNADGSINLVITEGGTVTQLTLPGAI